MWGKPYKYKGDGSLTLVHKHKKTGRNEYCSCDSGKKYKHCCGKKKVKDPLAWYVPWLAVVAVLLIIYLFLAW